MTPSSPASDGTRFDAAGLARLFDQRQACRTRRCSARDAGWESVLVRVAQRRDTSGNADLGVLAHPRILLVTKGAVAVQRRDGPTRRSAQLVPGKAWLIPGGAPLRYDWTRAGGATREMVTAVLPMAELDRTAELLRRRRSAPATWTDTVLAEDRVVHGVLTGLARAVATGADELYAESSAAFLLAHLLSNYGTGSPDLVVVGKEDARVRTAIEFMRDNLHLPLALADIAACAGLSPYHFLRVFRASTGAPPHRYLTLLRIDAARRRLADDDVSVTDVARLCGFGSASQFSTAFRRETGMSPRTFRRGLND